MAVTVAHLVDALARWVCFYNRKDGSSNLIRTHFLELLLFSLSKKE